MLSYTLYTLFILSCAVLVVVILLQPGKSGAGDLFSSSVSSTAFGPRGTASILSKVTIGAAAAFILRGFPSLHAAPGTLGAALRIGVTSLLFTVLYLGSVTLLYWGCTPLYQLAGLVREMVPWGKLSKRFERAGEAGAHTEGQPAVTPEKANELVS